MRAGRIFGTAVLGAIAFVHCTGGSRTGNEVAVQTRAMSDECVAALQEQPVTPMPEEQGLAPVTSCADLLPAITEQALREMNATLDRNLQEALQIHCQPCQDYGYGGYWDGGYGGYGDYGDYGNDDSSSGFGCGSSLRASSAGSADGGAYHGYPSADGGAGAWGGFDAGVPSSDGDDSADEYSTTNNQVAGADEPDFLKNDGAYIYIVANGTFRIIDAWPPEEAHTLAAVQVEGTPTGLFVYADRAVVYSVLGTYVPPCTYTYGCQIAGTGGPFVITVWDLTDRTNPVRLRRIESNGSLVNSRRMGGIVHTISVFGQDGYGLDSAWSDWPASVSRTTPYCNNSYLPQRTPAEIWQAFTDLRAANTKAIRDAMTVDRILGAFPRPVIVDERFVGDQIVRDDSQLNDCRDFFATGSTDGRQVLTLTSFDLTAAEPLAVTTVVGSAGAVYANPTSLYVAQPVGAYYQYGSSERSLVHKFHLAEDRAATGYAGSGTVQGHILNQFALDEHDGYLRVATSIGWVPDPSVHSAVTVLAESEGRLDVVGLLDNIAPGEDIRAVRFAEDVAYVVTFKKTDPLFVIDLSDPRHPVMQGELKIPGFSTYMQPMDATHVIGIGFDASDQGDFAWFTGLQLQIFDVANPDSPALLFKEVIGTRGSTSDATANHLAFNYFAPKDLMAVPMVICEGGDGNGNYGTRMTFDGLLVWRATVAEGFQKLGGIPHSDPAVSDANGLGCSNWWANPDSGVKRSIIMDDYVYSVALDNIKVSALADLAHPVAAINLLQ
jgi:hypothetical protein